MIDTQTWTMGDKENATRTATDAMVTIDWGNENFPQLKIPNALMYDMLKEIEWQWSDKNNTWYCVYCTIYIDDPKVSINLHFGFCELNVALNNALEIESNAAMGIELNDVMGMGDD